MSAEYMDTALAQIRDVIARLQTPVPDTNTLLQLLCAPLDSIGLLPPRFRQYNVSPLSRDCFSIARHIPPLQRALLEHIIPTWGPVLIEEDAHTLVEQFFCPDSISFASPAAGQIAVLAYSSILSLPLSEASVRLLVKLINAYPIDVLHSVVYKSGSKEISGKREVTWEDCVRNVAAIPAKVANFLGGTTPSSPVLAQGTYFNNVSVRCETLLKTLAANPSRENISSMTYLITKLVNIGVFSPFRPVAPSQPSFFEATLPVIRTRIASNDISYANIWHKILSSLPSIIVLQSVITSLFASLADIPPDLDPSPRARALVKREAQLLRSLVGRLDKDNGELLDCFSAVALGREWSDGHARIFACWAAGAEAGRTDTEALEAVSSKVVDMWTTPDHVTHSLLSRHRYLTSLLLLVLFSFRPASSALQKLALSPPFITGISKYISHLDPAVRRCGMLVAEEVARGAGKKLDFGDWEGNDQGKDWCLKLRQLVRERDADAIIEAVVDTTEESNGEVEADISIPSEVSSDQRMPQQPTRPVMQDAGYDSDDSLTGYASPPSSSRSASPTPSELAEIEKDPTLRVGQKKVSRPVYLAQLGEMVRSTSGLRTEQEDMEAQKHEVALDVAEELIRRKRSYGTELEENAVNLVHGFLGLQDSYDIAKFNEKRQAALNALVACCPHKAAPSLIEEFFRNQYSTDQRYVILNALAMGACELASLSLPPSSTLSATSAERIAFPSKRLPPALHKKYITTGDHDHASDPVQHLLEGLSRSAIDKGKDATAEKVPEIVRERRLRIRRPAKVSEVTPGTSSLSHHPAGHLPKTTTFTEVAAEHFICPLINRFWLFLRDEQARETRTMHQPALHQYRGAGTGLVLNAVVLARFLSTLAVLVHAARNAKEWLAIIAPDALELAMTIGTRPVSLAEGEDEDDDLARDSSSPGKGDKRQGKEAAVLTAALELALIVLDGCLDLDDGRSLGLAHTALFLGVGEWARKVFSELEKGVRATGEGGTHEIKLRRAAAGVVLKVDEVTSKWRRSMIGGGPL